MAGLVRNGQGARQALATNDLSVGRCAIKTESHPLGIGSVFGPKVNGLEILGVVTAWTSGLRAGLEFERPLHPAVADHLARAKPHVSRRRCPKSG